MKTMKSTGAECDTAIVSGGKTPMTCEELSVELSAYYDGELQGVEKENVEQHLRSCKPCQDTLEKMGGISRALTGLAGRSGEKHSMLEEIMNRVAEETSIEKKMLS